MTADRRPSAVLAEAVELLGRSELVLVARLADMTDAQNGHPRSAALDSSTSSGTGTADPTGSAGVLADRAASDRRQVERAIRSIARQADDLATLLARYGPHAPTVVERKATTLANERDDSCWSCARVGAWAPTWRSVEVANGGRVRVCRWCYDWVVAEGAPPAPELLRLHLVGKQVRRRVAARHA